MDRNSLFNDLDSFIRKDMSGGMVVRHNNSNKKYQFGNKKQSTPKVNSDNKNNSVPTKMNDTVYRQQILERFSKYRERKLYLELLEEHSNKVHKPFITTKDIPKPYIPYQTNSDTPSISDHIGQRKLFLCEIQFLVECYKKVEDKNEKVYAVYAGSAPTNKGMLLSKMFPNVKFILVDPNCFDLKDLKTNESHRKKRQNDVVHIYNNYELSGCDTYLDNKKLLKYDETDKKNLLHYIKNDSHKIFIIEDYMDNNIAELCSKLPNVYFVSDVRSNVLNIDDSRNDEYPHDIDIVWNTSMCFNWIYIMQPILSQLKFRPPFRDEKDTSVVDKKNDGLIAPAFEISLKNGIDFISDYEINNTFKMSKGKIYLQTWPGTTSSESRLVIKQKNISNIKEYDSKDYENVFFTYNKVYRKFCYHENKNANKSINFCNCNDCAIENKIYEDYNKYVGEFNFDDIFSTINKVTSRPLTKHHTYPLFKTLNLGELHKLIEYYYNTIQFKVKHKQKKQIGNLGANVSGGIKTPTIFTQFVSQNDEEENIVGGHDSDEDMTFIEL